MGWGGVGWGGVGAMRRNFGDFWVPQNEWVLPCGPVVHVPGAWVCLVGYVSGPPK